DVLFEFVNTFTQGLAITRATELGVESYAMVVLDPASAKVFGGTAYFFEKWRSGDRKDRVIDLAAIRSQGFTKPRAFSESIKSPQAAGNEQKIKREIKVMLFSDVKNFSKLDEEQAPSFFAAFLAEVARVIENSQNLPVFRNTWGDGLFLVFDRVTDCADFAMRLLDRIQQMDFKKLGLPEDTTVRMGIHAGPVYPYEDKIIDRKNFFGSHVNRAARIEPVATPGCAFTSEQFAAVLAVETGHDFICEYVGVEDLAKGYDRVPLYRLGRR
ncbi:MAG: adenylate/guanylate cyclase domain-containing protein, partial [Candidatus Binatia bacterium]